MSTLIEKLELEKQWWHDDGENNVRRLLMTALISSNSTAIGYQLTSGCLNLVREFWLSRQAALKRFTAVSMTKTFLFGRGIAAKTIGLMNKSLTGNHFHSYQNRQARCSHDTHRNSPIRLLHNPVFLRHLARF